MSRPISEICNDIDTFRPIDEEWLPLDDLIAESLDHPDATSAFSSLLAVFARFPDDDGAGVFWSIIHGLESVGGYESRLLEAVQTTPTDMTVMMLNRMLNGGISELDGVSLLGLLQSISQNEAYSDSVRAAASRFANRHSA